MLAICARTFLVQRMVLLLQPYVRLLHVLHIPAHPSCCLGAFASAWHCSAAAGDSSAARCLCWRCCCWCYSMPVSRSVAHRRAGTHAAPRCSNKRVRALHWDSTLTGAAAATVQRPLAQIGQSALSGPRSRLQCTR
jgi:hypothetical protein